MQKKKKKKKKNKTNTGTKALERLVEYLGSFQQIFG